MHRSWHLCLVAAVLGGCGGQYVFTAPDQLAPAGGSTVAVVRIQRHEFMNLVLPVQDAPVRLWVADGPLRAAYADKSGYAGAAVPVPDKAGLYELHVATQDIRGEEFTKPFPAYVWDASSPIVAVDLDCLPMHGKTGDDARGGLARLAKEANILYFTTRDVTDYPRIHEELQGNHFPDGVILPWRRSDWRGTAMTSELSQLRQQFAALNVGVCTSAAAASAFNGAGMECVVIGDEKVAAAKVSRRTWADLAAKGL